MFYSIRHVTRFHYSAQISESVMEVRMRPRTELNQRCLKHELHITPRVHIDSFRDYLGNTVHHFDVPGVHSKLSIVSAAVVEVKTQNELPEGLAMNSWQNVDDCYQGCEHWEMQSPSKFALETEKLAELRQDIGLDRSKDPLTTLRELNTRLYEEFAYIPKATKVDSPIDLALENRKGVCQDFAHIMIALTRGLKIPCRYVSGYLHHRATDEDRSPSSATHAWVEANLPGLGWVAFDPTNNLLAGERHIRTAVGRDYADVPPTKGVFRGKAASELSVSVRVSTTDAPPDDNDVMVLVERTLPLPSNDADFDSNQQQQQQQQ